MDSPLNQGFLDGFTAAMDGMIRAFREHSDRAWSGAQVADALDDGKRNALIFADALVALETMPAAEARSRVHFDA